MDIINMLLVRLLLVAVSLVIVSGCSTRLEATAVPDQSLNQVGKVYVQHFSPDKRNLNYIIADKLSILGYPAIPLDGGEVPDDADIVITYIDNWQWDITNYLIKIKIDFRRAQSKELIISGESYRTSLARKDPEFMIQETLEIILKEAGLSYNYVENN